MIKRCMFQFNLLSIKKKRLQYKDVIIHNNYENVFWFVLLVSANVEENQNDETLRISTKCPCMGITTRILFRVQGRVMIRIRVRVRGKGMGKGRVRWYWSRG